MGRKEELARLHQKLKEGNPISVVGMAGVGKTELVAEYANSHGKEYEDILWFDSNSTNLAGVILDRFQLKLLPEELQIPQELKGKLLNSSQQVAWCWNQYPESDSPILIVFDDVSDINQLLEVLPERRPIFRVLITTRLQRLYQGTIRDFPLDVLCSEKAKELLQKVLGESDQRLTQQPTAADKLLECLGYLPLGIQLVGGYLAADPDLPLATMESEIQEKKLASSALESSDTSPQLGVKALFDLTWSRLTPSAQQLGQLLSLFAPQKISWDLVLRVATEAESDVESKQLTWSKAKINEAKKELYKISILQLGQKEQGYYKLHPLLRWFLEEKIPRIKKIQFKKVILHTFRYLVENEFPDIEDCQKMMKNAGIIPHLQFIVNHQNSNINNNYDEQNQDNISWIYYGIAQYFNSNGLLLLAMDNYKQSWSFAKKKSPLLSPILIDNLLKIAELEKNESNKYKYYLEALKFAKINFYKNENHPVFAAILNGLAHIDRNNKDLDKAIKKYERAIHIYARNIDIKNDIIYLFFSAITLDNLGGVYVKKKNFSKAFDYHNKSLSFFNKILNKPLKEQKETHYIVGLNKNKVLENKARCLYNLAICKIEEIFDKKRKVSHKEISEIKHSYLKKGLEIFKYIWGNENPKLLEFLKIPIDAYMKINDREEVKQKYREFDKIYKTLKVEDEKNLYSKFLTRVNIYLAYKQN